MYYHLQQQDLHLNLVPAVVAQVAAEPTNENKGSLIAPRATEFENEKRERERERKLEIVWWFYCWRLKNNMVEIVSMCIFFSL